MTNTILLLGAAIIFIVALLFILANSAKRNKGTTDYPYTLKPTLFSAAERSFLGVLEQAVPDDCRVFGKVRVADVVSVIKMKDQGRLTRAFNRISAKHFDYVVCRKSDLKIICVVELDDQSHQQKKRQKRDQFLTAVCTAASLPILQVAAKHGYSPLDLRAKIATLIAPLESFTVQKTGPVMRQAEPLLNDPA